MTPRHHALAARPAPRGPPCSSPGCGTQESLVGLHAAPAEKTASAPLDVEGATAVAARLLAQAEAATAREGRRGGQEGSRGRPHGRRPHPRERRGGPCSRRRRPRRELATEPEPTVVAQSPAGPWPRAILAATLDEESNTQFLHVMLSEKPEEPFRIAAAVPMFGGATLPALGDSSAGAPLLDANAKDGLALAPKDAVAAYAAALAYPKAKASDAVSVDDPFATRLKATAAAQTKALGKLGGLTQAHAPLLEHAVTFRLADGGAVTFGLMRRTDTIGVKKTAKELVLPAEYAKVIGKKKVTKSLSLQNLEPFVLVVPRTGAAKVIGASELLVSGKGR